MLPKFLTQIDLAKRWGISKQAVTNRKARHKNDFPKAAMMIGDMEVYRETDVKKYEKKYPARKSRKKK